MSGPLLEVNDLVKHFVQREFLMGREVSRVRAVDGVSFGLHPGETLGIVGSQGAASRRWPVALRSSSSRLPGRIYSRAPTSATTAGDR